MKRSPILTAAVVLVLGAPAARALAQTTPVRPPANQASPSTDAVSEAYYLFLQARTLEARGQLDAAIAAHRRAIELLPQAAEPHAELAALYARDGRAQEAITEAEAALALDPDSREAHRILGFVQSALSERIPPQGGTIAMVAEAIGHLEKALVGRRDPGMELTLSRLYLRNQQYAEATKSLREFLLMQPGYPDALQMLAVSLQAQGDVNGAIEVLTEALRAAPDEPRARVQLAEMLEVAGKWPEAAALWGGLAKTAPTSALYRTRQATAQLNAGDTAGAQETLLAFTRDLPREPIGWYLLSQVERRLGNLDAAEAAARRILEQDPDDPRGLLALAQTKTVRGDFRAVIDTLQARVDSPRAGDNDTGLHARLAGELANAYRQTGDPARALQILEAAATRTPDDDDLIFDLSAMYEQAGQIDKAESGFRDLIARDPRNASALNYLGYMLAERGQKLDEAVMLVRRALLIDPENTSYLDSLGWALFKRGQASDARAPLEKAAAGRPTSSVIQAHMGDVYFELKDYRAAVAAFERALAGDKQGIDVDDVTRKRNRARELAGR
ncbi:MAG TPA: tetratricopeptide repeat protein [Vicinamibacterales bacterium]|nr:tetratricopeptide repeat protein [Vicinamibacterales bacterium]